jgi:hypothetical protein
LEHFYKEYFSNPVKDPELLNKIRKELCAVLAFEDFTSTPPTVSINQSRLDPQESQDKKPIIQQSRRFADLNL